MDINASPDAETRRIMENYLHYPLVVLRAELDDLLGLRINDDRRRHAEQHRNKRQIEQVRRAMKILADHST